VQDAYLSNRAKFYGPQVISHKKAGHRAKKGKWGNIMVENMSVGTYVRKEGAGEP
jgi:hypothetical protein